MAAEISPTVSFTWLARTQLVVTILQGLHYFLLLFIVAKLSKFVLPMMLTLTVEIPVKYVK